MPEGYKVNIVAARRKDESGKIMHIAPVCFRHTVNGSFFAEWFRKELVKCIPKGSTVIMYNATHHPKKRLARLVRRHGMRLLFLPTYSPDLNPIESRNQLFEHPNTLQNASVSTLPAFAFSLIP